MTDKKIEYFRQIKERVKQEDDREVRDLGYFLSCGINKDGDQLSIEVRVRPLGGSVNPGEEFLETMKRRLTDKYQVPFNIHYIPTIEKRDGQ